MNKSSPDISDDQDNARETDEISDPNSYVPALPEDWNYEATVTTIESIISQIETGELPIADVFEQFETAVNRLQQCESFLTHHRQQVDLLIETLNDDEEPVP
ncbi:MAG: exodeoxyribonuclease VII small subunit [Elainellaceae cyanobacterium]